MPDVRLTGVPIDHVEAELVAYPLTSEKSFQLGQIELDPKLTVTTGRLWRGFEAEVFGGLRGFSLDEIIAVRDRVWFGSPGGAAVPLHEFLARQAGLFLEPRGEAATPHSGGPIRAGRPPGERDSVVDSRWRWRWLSFAIPPDLLLAAFGPGGPTYVESLSPVLARHLDDSGYAESHLHLGAALEFPHLWSAVLHRLSLSDTRETLFSSPGAAFGEGHRLGPWLLRAAIARYCLGHFLLSGTDVNFRTYFFSTVMPRVTARLGSGYASLLKICILELMRGRTWATASPPFDSLRHLYASITGSGAIQKPGHIDEVHRLDPLASASRFSRGDRLSPEMIFLREGLRRLGTGHSDPWLEGLFWQIARMRGAFYRHVVQRPLTPGLPWFIRFFDRLRPARGWLGVPLRVQSALTMSGAGSGLRSLEVRTAPENSEYELIGLVSSVRGAVGRFFNGLPGLGDGKPEIGLVLHFIKEKGHPSIDPMPPAYGQRSHAAPRPPSNLLRYSDYFQSQHAQARAMVDAIRAAPSILQIIRGIDLCSEEQGVPNWLFVPLFAQIRSAIDEVNRRRLQANRAVTPLRTTIHVGEDFPHPLSGLRSVADAVQFFNLTEGDRIGHGMALGVDVEEWCRRVGRTPMTREDRLFDLLWEWDWCSRNPGNSGTRRLYLERELSRLAELVFGHSVALDGLRSLRYDLNSRSMLERIGYPARGRYFSQPPPERLELFWSYLSRASVFQRGQAIEWINPIGEGEYLAELQDQVRAEVARRGLVVEVNPSSNLLIGDLGDLNRHPLWRLSPPRRDGKRTPVAVCLGSDDPITFATSIRHEFQLVFDALLSAGLTTDLAFEWIDRARENGLRSRFTSSRDR